MDSNKKQGAPWWVVVLFFIFGVYTFVTDSKRSFKKLDEFKSALTSQDTPIKYYSITKITADRQLNPNWKVFTKKEINCLLSGVESWFSGRLPSRENSNYQVLHIETDEKSFRMTMRFFKGKIYYDAWLKQDIGYKSYGFSAVGECETVVGAHEI
ncbi:hypothetical protein AN214_02199 [Pseudoalteromonas sp. P1-9]|uniref:hypothetical protein n=1 Tax=Pseudoalteromonas sp. P1-9 TaxID=1710354 RepID=UPI0006D5E361|nr:hypothetical protein [Pseudoalteromonas sp. P1-9]KPV95812.1 hypothetical protein AN214_02199 [Pseudoalteromonas sp. P1-9]